MGTKLNQEFCKEMEATLEKYPEDRQIFMKGYGQDVSVECFPEYNASPRCEIFGGEKNNAQVVITGDRPASIASGFGGKGHTGASSIDIVAGRMGADQRPVTVDPSFSKDAARIYISQKTDIDDNFKIKQGNVGKAKARSAIGMKADAIRIISRDGGIKLVTGVDRKNSQGGEIKSVTGVEIIAGNDDGDVQPMVKGANLSEALKRMTGHVDKLNGIVDNLLTTQMNFNESLTHHFHYSPWYGNATTPSDAVVGKGIKTSIDFLQETKRSLVTHKTNLVNFKQTYLEPSGCKYINSRWNSTN